MKKILGFIFFLGVVIFIFILSTNYEKNYELKYKLENNLIQEKYDKDLNYYYFTINDKVDYVINHKYVNKRKLVKKVYYENDCYQINVFNKKTESICVSEDSYNSPIKISDNKVIKSYDNVEIYNNNYNIYVWNNYGITDLITQKKYNFLSNESYDNSLYYELDNYLIFADYDQKREFNKFYIFNKKSKKISSFKLDYKISFKSYFMGNVDDDLYLYDKDNETQYKINIKNKKIKITSDNNGLYFYNLKLDKVSKTKYKYNEEKFVKANVYNYEVLNNNLYYFYYNSNHKILIDNDVKEIIKINDNEIYYLKDEALYKYNVNTQKQNKIINYFEWNFNYKNKIFIFN